MLTALLLLGRKHTDSNANSHIHTRPCDSADHTYVCITCIWLCRCCSTHCCWIAVFFRCFCCCSIERQYRCHWKHDTREVVFCIYRFIWWPIPLIHCSAYSCTPHILEAWWCAQQLNHVQLAEWNRNCFVIMYRLIRWNDDDFMLVIIIVNQEMICGDDQCAQNARNS